MNKADLVSAVAEKTGLTKKVAEQTVGVIFDAITDGLKKEGKVQLVGLGSSEVKVLSARMGRTPKPKNPFRFRLPKLPSSKLAKR